LVTNRVTDMKRFILGFTTALLVAGSALADPAEIIKQKALAIRDMNNQQQGITPATAPTPAYTAPAPAPAAPSGPSATQQALMDRLQVDLNAIKSGAPATADQAVALQNDMNTLAKGANKPTKPELAKLSTDLAAALSEKTLSAVEMAQLTKNINIVLNCSVISAAYAQTFVSAAQAALRNSGVSDAKVDAVGGDLRAVVNEIQKSKAKLYQ
jgi:hypothetical protein